MIAQALGTDWFWSYAPALIGDDFRPLSGPDPGGPAYGNLLVSRLPLERVEHLRFPPAGGGEQRTALLATIQVGSRPVTVAATHLSNKQGHNVRQLRELQGLTGSRAAPRLLVGDLNMPSTVLVFASRRGWPETGRGRTWPNSAPTQQLDPVLRDDPAEVIRPRRPGGRPPSTTTAPWWSSSTSPPADQAPTSSWPSAPDDRQLAQGRSTTASSRPEVGCRPLGETGPAVAVFCQRSGPVKRCPWTEDDDRSGSG